jgi:hypothetical protein
MRSAGLETAILASEWPQIHALDRAAAGIVQNHINGKNYELHHCLQFFGLF